MRKFFIFILIALATLPGLHSNAQTDSALNLSKPDSATKVNNGKEILLDTLTPQKDKATLALAKKDSLIQKKHDPHKATIRSAILPGWGQAYNHEYWKIPIVYGALAVPGSLFIYNNKWYQKTKDAYIIVVNEDTANYANIDPKLQGLSAADLQYYRNSFRKNRDYSVLFFFLVWGLNVVDATVFAQLKDFDVGKDLSMHIQPDYNIGNKSPSLAFVFNYKEPKKKTLPSSF